MSKKPKKKSKPRLTPKDIKLWQRITHDVERLDGADYITIDESEAIKSSENSPNFRAESEFEALLGGNVSRESLRAPKASNTALNSASRDLKAKEKKGLNPNLKPNKIPNISHDLDRRTDDRLRKGKIRPEAKIDLHGLGQDEALTALIDFIQGAYQAQKRCVLVITGKGAPKTSSGFDHIANPNPNQDPHWLDRPPGILKRRMPDWLTIPHLAPYILKTYPAQPKDGGSGAFYVYLRRAR